MPPPIDLTRYSVREEALNINIPSQGPVVLPKTSLITCLICVLSMVRCIARDLWSMGRPNKGSERPSASLFEFFQSSFEFVPWQDIVK